MYVAFDNDKEDWCRYENGTIREWQDHYSAWCWRVHQPNANKIDISKVNAEIGIR